MKKELLLLKIRSLIEDKAMVTATANRELSLGGWLSDWQKCHAEIDGEIQKMIQELGAVEEEDQ